MGVLEGKKAIVTGGSAGIGHGCALRFAMEGADVVACARRIEKLGELAREAKDRGYKGRIIPVACDIAKESDLNNVVETAVAEFGGRIDILACIAQGALNRHSYFIDTKPDMAMDFFMTGPIQTMLLIQKCVPYMQKNRYGRILTCSSGAGVGPVPGFTGYSMAKAAIIALTRLAAKEFGAYGITTNCFLPISESEHFGENAANREEEQTKAALAHVRQSIPLGYIGKPFEDVAPALAFLASDGAHYINGQFIGVCGGATSLI